VLAEPRRDEPVFDDARRPLPELPEPLELPRDADERDPLVLRPPDGDLPDERREVLEDRPLPLERVVELLLRPPARRC
jgi:hypothetical protein